MRKTLYIGNFPSHQNAVEVERLISSAGTIMNFKMAIHDDIIHRYGGFAIVKMKNEAEAAQVARSLHGKAFHGAALDVRAATAQEKAVVGHRRMFGTTDMADDKEPSKRV